MKQILYEIGMVARALDSISNIEFKEFDLTKGQYMYLVRIHEQPGIILEKLAELLKVDKTTAARALQKLEKNGLIEKRDDGVNKKIKKLYTTQRGEAIYPFIIREHNYSTEVALAGLTAEEQQMLLQLVKRVRHNIEKDWEYVKKGNKREY